MDRISGLPQKAIEKILILMAIKDAGRTSILSRKWRFCWTSMPRLAFTLFDVPSDNEEIVPYDNEEFNKLKFVKDICLVLILHVGPLLDFSILINDIEIDNEIDPIILLLSRSNNIKKFSFVTRHYILPSSFFSMQGLELLDLTGCEIKPPLMFNGFSMLRSLCVNNCMITANQLLQFLINCPLLEEFTLGTHFLGVKKCEFVELFKCLASVQVLNMCTLSIKDFDVCGMPQKLPTSLLHLRIFVLDVCLLQQDEISCVLCLINSSPNLEKIKLEMCWDHKRCLRQSFKNLFDLEDHTDLKLDHLKELEITNFYNVAHEMEFVKLIMAKSPRLKLARLKLNADVTVDEEIKMFHDLVRRPFPRASASSDFIIERMPTKEMCWSKI